MKLDIQVETVIQSENICRRCYWGFYQLILKCYRSQIKKFRKHPSLKCEQNQPDPEKSPVSNFRTRKLKNSPLDYYEALVIFSTLRSGTFVQGQIDPTKSILIEQTP